MVAEAFEILLGVNWNPKTVSFGCSTVVKPNDTLFSITEYMSPLAIHGSREKSFPLTNGGKRIDLAPMCWWYVMKC